MTDIRLYTKISELPLNMKTQVSDFIDSLRQKLKKGKDESGKRISGKAKGLVTIKNNFDDPVEGFEKYI